MFFLTLCPIRSDYYLEPVFYWHDLLTFFSGAVFLAIPIGVFVFCWKNFVTNAPARRPAVSLLGLAEPALYSEPPPLYSEPPVYPETPLYSQPQEVEEADPFAWMVLLYLVTGLLTFSLGVFAFEAVHAFG